MPDLIRTRSYEPNKALKFRLDEKYQRFEVANRGEYELLVKFNLDETNWHNPDTVVKPYATQNLTSDYATDRIMVMADPSMGVVQNPTNVTPTVSILASDTGIASTPAYSALGLLQEGAALSSLETNDQPDGTIIYRTRADSDTYDRVRITNTGILSVGDGTAAPVAIGRIAGLDDLADYLPLSGGTMSGVLGMGGNKVQGVAVPTANGDATRKVYVDDGDAATLADAQAYADNYKWNFVQTRLDTALAAGWSAFTTPFRQGWSSPHLTRVWNSCDGIVENTSGAVMPRDSLVLTLPVAPLRYQTHALPRWDSTNLWRTDILPVQVMTTGEVRTRAGLGSGQRIDISTITYYS